MRVIVVDDSIIAREGLRRLIEAEGHQVIEVIGRPEHVERAVVTGDPDAVILDIRMPPTYTDEGIRVATALRALAPGLKILVLSQYATPEYATRLLQGGAAGTGYLLKDRILEPLQLSQALARLLDGGTVVDPDLVGELITSRDSHDALSGLSPREREVLRLMAEGRSDRGIADTMFISLNTVGTHIQHIFRKLALEGSATSNRRVLAVLTFLQKR